MHSFPQEEPSMQDQEKTKGQLIDELNEKTRILLVDDDPHLLQGMSRIW